jgi:4-amino-4-deoxy-L-arabinose transferase-like glycosyltransferase
MTAARTIVGASVLAVLTLALGWRAAGTDVVEGGEAREGLVAREMLETGDWILPLWNGTTIPSKPPLFHWLVVGGAVGSGEGVTERTLRAPSIALAVVVVLTVLVAGNVWGGTEVGLLATLVLATTPQFLKEAADGRVDMTLTAAVTASQMLLIEAFRRAAVGGVLPVALGLLLALAMLAKGPVGPGLVGLTALAVMAGARTIRPLRRLVRPLPVAVFVLVAGTWYGLATWHRGWDFIAKQIVSENGEALLGSDRFPWRSPLYYVDGLIVGGLPWTLLLPWAAMAACRGPLARRSSLLWAVVVFVVFSLAPLKRGAYLLPLRPALALVLGWWLAEAGRAAMPDRRAVAAVRAIAGTAGALGVACVALAALAAYDLVPAAALRAVASRHDVDVDAYVRMTAATSVELLLVGVGAAGAALWMARAAMWNRWGQAAVAMAIVVVAGTLVVRDVYWPGRMAQQSLRPFVLAVRERVPAAEPLTLLTVEEMADAGLPFVFYVGRHVSLRGAPGAQPLDVDPGYYVLDQARWAAWHDPAGWEEVLRSPHLFSRHRRDLVLVRRLASPRAPSYRQDDHAGVRAAADGVGERDLGAGDLARSGASPQLPHQLDDLPERRRAERLALGEEPATRVDRLSRRHGAAAVADPATAPAAGAEAELLDRE